MVYPRMPGYSMSGTSPPTKSSWAPRIPQAMGWPHATRNDVALVCGNKLVGDGMEGGLLPAVESDNMVHVVCLREQ